MFGGAVTGQVDEQQVFRAAAFGQRLRGTTQVLAGGHRPVAEVVTVVDQADLAISAKARVEHVSDVVGFAQEHALFAVAAEGQRV
ncbi:hypothetical protein D3C81_1168740 [compost metagenome]